MLYSTPGPETAARWLLISAVTIVGWEIDGPKILKLSTAPERVKVFLGPVPKSLNSDLQSPEKMC